MIERNPFDMRHDLGRRLAVLALLASLALEGRAQESPERLRIGAAEFARRRADLAAKLGDGVLAIDAGPLREPGNDANTPVFDFKYLTGVHDDDGLLVLTGRKSVLFVGEPEKVSGAGVEEVLPAARFEEWAAANLAGQARVYTKLRQKHLDELKKAAPATEVVGGRLGAEIIRLRLIKSDLEMALMRKAADATNKALVAAMRKVRPGLNEREVQDVILATFKKEGCPEIGFPPICGSGKNGTVLHYMANKEPIPADTLMVCDVGAAIDNYVTDITRTVPTSGRFGEEQRKHYQCVLDAQKAAEAVLAPGATFSDLERAARKVFEDRGLLKWSYAHSEDRSVRHGLGHYVGMSVHDSGTYREKFAAGMVITIEPGWYDKDAGYGIRIEDTYLVTKDGFDRLSAGAPREIEEIEKVMSARKEY
jgi:Xaa-Pro aminopeptidase